MIKEFVPLKEMLKSLEDNNIGKKNGDYMGFILEVNNMTIGERLKEIRLVTQRPYHLFQYLGEGIGIMLVLESSDPKTNPRLSFRGISIIDSIESAEKYVAKEIKVGAIEPEPEEKEKSEEESKEETEEKSDIDKENIPDEALKSEQKL